MEVGNFVRTKDGWIYKIEDGEEFYEDSVDVGIGTIPDVDGIWIDKAHFQYVDKREIIKSSPNIIDLIEVGDYVNGEKIAYITNDNKLITEGGYDIFSKYKDIGNVVTKEMFESMEYKVGE